MSLFEWSTPARQSVNRTSIPNEIYLYILQDSIASPNEYLKEEELKIFSNLSRVCKFFANVCLPRIFEFVVFRGFMFRDFVQERVGPTLSAHIAEQQPLALTLAQRVKSCHFGSWEHDFTGSRVGGMHIAAISYMKNICEVRFSACSVEAKHWSAIVALPSLENLSFESCELLSFPADLEPKNIKLKVSQLFLDTCNGCLMANDVDVAHLRTFGADTWSLDIHEHELSWLRNSAVTEFHVDVDGVDEDNRLRLDTILLQIPRSLEVLYFNISVIEVPFVARDILQSMSDNPSAWRDLYSLRFLILQVVEDWGPVTDELSKSITDDLPKLKHILCDKFGSGTSLSHVDYFGRAIRLVDGKWSESVL